MKKIVIILCLCLMGVTSLFAQGYMIVHTKENSTQFPISEIEYVDFKYEVELSVSQSYFAMEAEGGEISFSVNCNTGFDINTDVAWIERTSLAIMGAIHYKVLANESTQSRTGHIIVTAGDKEVIITVEQKGIKSISCRIDLANITVLSDAIMADYEMTDDVIGYFELIVDKTLADKYEDDFFAAYLMTRELNTVEYPFIYATELESSADYLFLALPIDKNGNVGSLMKRFVRTASSVSQPQAEISNLTLNASTLRWTTTNVNHCASYYMLVNLDKTPYFSQFPDIFVAYIINAGKSSLPLYNEFGGWQMGIKADVQYIEIATWGMDYLNQMSGVLSTSYNNLGTRLLVKNEKPSVKKTDGLDIPHRLISRQEMNEVLAKSRIIRFQK